MPYKILVASGSTVIPTLSFDPTVSPPTLSVVSSTPSAKGPTWITAHPVDKSIVYAGIAQKEGKVQAFKIVDEAIGKLELVKEVGTGGGSAHVVATSTEIISASYGQGTSTTLPIDPVTHLPGEAIHPSITYPFSAPGPRTGRQDSSHPHQVVVHPTRPEVLIPDLGADKTWRLLQDDQGKWEIKGFVEHIPGSGPRHAIIYNDVLYTLQELSLELSAHTLPPLPATSTFITTVPTLTPPFKPTPEMLTAELIFTLHPTPLLYATNRNHPSPLGDTISIYTLSPTLTLVNEVHTGVSHLRGAAFVGEDDKYIIIGGQNGGGIKVYERIGGGLELKEVAKLEEGVVETPASFLWI